MILANLSDKKLVLASKSPRRQQLLAGLDIHFEVKTKDVPEIYPPALQREEIPRYLSRLKADAFRSELADNEIIITSDTIVYLDGKVIEKPTDSEDAKEMLRKLSGKCHTVITAVTLMSTEHSMTFHDETNVWFKPLSEDEIAYYVNRYSPLDKAGAYGVQEFIGYIGVTRMEGSYFNVMGLPLHRLYEALQNF
jgi:septum formation protein